MSRLHRPENAQKRAKEFLDVGKPSRALDCLYEVIRRNKMRSNTSEAVLEPIMIMYLNLCVDLKKSHLAKEGLYQYRNVFQTTNVNTLEKVVRLYLQMAEDRTEAARKESHEAVMKNVDDLDNLRTPEELLLAAVSGEDAQDRSDRTILTPWLKFLWESYRQSLELLRNNSLVEKLYHDLAKKAFSFCEKYQRKTEFRKLCDNLLTHLQHLQKPSASARAVSLSNPETQQMNLETRLEQLNFAIKMESWQEAYRAIEYVSDLMTKSKKSPKPQIMSSYYSKLSLVFWKAGNELFHAAALLKLFQLNKEQKKNITADEVSKRAAVVLVATMSIPLPSSRPEFDRFIETEKSALEKVSRLAALLSLPKAPTRASLFKELVKCGVLGSVAPELQATYNILEVDFDPLNLCPKMEEKLEWVGKRDELVQYVPAMKTMTVTRLVKQLAQIYSSVTFDWLLKTSVFMNKFQIERILVDLVRHNDQQIRVDHRNNCVNFGSALSECQREDLPEGPTLQCMPSENIRNQLVHVYKTINKCVQLIAPDAKKKEMDQCRKDSISIYSAHRVKEHNKILQRQQTIEVRKEKLENQTIEREESIRRALEEQQMKQKLEEQERLKREASEREKQRQEEQRKQIQTKQIKDKLQQISGTSYGQKMIEKFNENSLMTLDAETILQVQVEELEKERKELMQRLKAQEKKVDYMERAKRLAEIPKYIEIYKEQKKKDAEFWNAEQQKNLKKAQEEHARCLEMSKRFNHMRKDLDGFLNDLKSARRSETEKKMSDFKAILEVERKKRLLERREQRKRDRRDAFLKEKAEEEQRCIDEQLKLEKEMKEKEEAERHRLEELEYTKRKEELDRQEKLRKEKESEIERKLKERDYGSGPVRPEKDEKASSWRGSAKEEAKEGVWRPGVGNTTWREKEQEKIETWRKKDEEVPRRSALVSKDIRLEEDFIEERKLKDNSRGDEVRATSEDDQNKGDRFQDQGPRDKFRDDDRFGKRSDDRFEKKDDRFERRDDRFERRDDRFERRGDDRRGGFRGDNRRGGEGGFERRGDGGFERRGEGGFERRGEGGFERRGEGGFERRGEGGFERRGEGGFERRGEGGFERRGEGGFERRGEGAFERRGGGGFERRGEGAGFERRGEGGFERRAGRGGEGGGRRFEDDRRGGGGEWRKDGGTPRGGRDFERGNDEGSSWRRAPAAESRGQRLEEKRGGPPSRGDDRRMAERKEKVVQAPDADGWTHVRKS